MSVDPSKLAQQAKDLAAKDAAKAKAWFGNNWYAFGIGVIATLVVLLVLHGFKGV
jgi:uncharacterized membrane protein YkgB